MTVRMQVEQVWRRIQRGSSLDDHWIGVIVAVLVFGVLLATSGDSGVTWDEPIYMQASESYVQWIGELFLHPGSALRNQTIDQYWELNHEHPPFDKAWSGIFWSISRYVVNDITAHRMGNIVMSSVLAGLLYYFIAQNYGKVAGFGAAFALFSMPRFFFHAHLAALDVPASATIFLACTGYWIARDKQGAGWYLLPGLAFGIAASTKINGLVGVPVVLLLWSLVFDRRIENFLRILVMIVTGIVVWFLSWPWLYHSLIPRLFQYIQFLTVHHAQTGQWYLGQLYMPPPWHYPFVMTLTVVPVTIILLAIFGTVSVLSRWRTEKFGWLLIAFTAFPLILVALKFIAAFDDERLLMPAFPFLAALAGIGFGYVIRLIGKIPAVVNLRIPASVVVGFVGILCLIPQVISASRIYPHLLAYYSEIVGGIAGASKLGMETTYWAESYQASLAYLNAKVPEGSTVWVEAMDVMRYYQKVGMLRKDIRVAAQQGDLSILQGIPGYTLSISDADYAVIENRQSGFTTDIVNWIDSHQPVYGIQYDKIQLMNIYTK